MRLENSSLFCHYTDSSEALHVPFYTNQRAQAAARHLSPVMQTKIHPYRLIPVINICSWLLWVNVCLYARTTAAPLPIVTAKKSPLDNIGGRMLSAGGSIAEQRTFHPSIKTKCLCL